MTSDDKEKVGVHTRAVELLEYIDGVWRVARKTDKIVTVSI